MSITLKLKAEGLDVEAQPNGFIQVKVYCVEPDAVYQALRTENFDTAKIVEAIGAEILLDCISNDMMVKQLRSQGFMISED